MIKIKLNHILSAIVVGLLILCWASVYTPMHFNNVKNERERAVKERLIAIRKAEEIFKQRNGTYAATFKQLIDCKLLADSMQYVPYSDKQTFELTTTIHMGKSKTPVSLMECGTQYAVYLNGMDEKQIKDITEEANDRGDFPGLKIGDITTPNDNAGNWE